MTLMEGMMSEVLILGFKKTADILKQYKINVTEKEKVNIINKINRNFESEVAALRFCDKAPVLNNKGIYILSQEQKTKIKKVAKELELQNMPNDPHALLTKEPIWTADPVVFDYNFTDFSVIKYFRDEGHKPAVLSANAVLICPENEEILVHERSEQSDTYPNKIHIFGGAYIPATSHNVAPDRAGFRSTIAREILEETQASVPTNIKAPFFITKELKTGFIQVNFLGICLTSDQSEELEHNWEGSILKIKFRDIHDFILDMNDVIVPSGRVAILSWLALGAPGVKYNQKFSNYNPKDLFIEIIDRPYPK